ncbi:bifunctional UDP-N-acetylglucosamine diphosphorylase/glucosamine-1-phosphate N-acetyltransferase GlmU [Pararhizobium mangrovi]|uniref:Bifunctional protein GlmU n=1 Tax=Pararhizobium mangrovi TaxID=2590452 RepID=A0A506U1C5_9HYPH|nr:bifunctional UDP-N-acetylglucosamine diphosphorylase/glucosamine-1-phosphate N-acetyltransferase GlmU [Pararhizobium mangrovi]TPW27560.1 bifunctional UDP-N-acetylglucosamine diphosphorylase/glucosamine-1-phosphate N-acetyltransferase GlmU [Pararhizobium mangrovi]
MERKSLAIILAAGEGTRMKSALPKVLHPVGGRAMLAHVVEAVAEAGIERTALVVGRQSETVAESIRSGAPSISVFEQGERLGTAHAVLAAREALEETPQAVLVLFGDTPLVRAETLARASAALEAEDAAVVVVGFRTPRPTGYGRLVEEDGALVAIREEKDASEAERKIDFCNGGAMAIDGRRALSLIEAIGNDNAKGEYYLTDIVALARSRGARAVAIEVDENELVGVNTRVELAAAETLWQHRRREALMLSGVTMTAPETVFLAWDTEIARDVTIEPNVVFGPAVTVGEGATIRAFSHLEGARVSPGAEIGPYARLRPGAEIGKRAKVGNFCEVKKAEIGTGAKINHLSYIGDATVGEGVNVGAGTITCNYDGANKHRTEIGAHTFVGSNTSLVAPLSIGADSYIASGSVVTDAVPEGTLAFGRARQVNKPGRAHDLRERILATKRSKENGNG